MQRIEVVFTGSIDDEVKDCKVLSALERFELAKYFLFNFNVPDGSFRTIVIRRNLMIIQECENMLPIFYKSFLKIKVNGIFWVNSIRK